MMETGLNGACIRLYGMVPRMRAAVARIIALNGFLRCYGINARLRHFRAYVGRVVLYMAMRPGGMICRRIDSGARPVFRRLS